MPNVWLARICQDIWPYVHIFDGFQGLSKVNEDISWSLMIDADRTQAYSQVVCGLWRSARVGTCFVFPARLLFGWHLTFRKLSMWFLLDILDIHVPDPPLVAANMWLQKPLFQKHSVECVICEDMSGYLNICGHLWASSRISENTWRCLMISDDRWGSNPSMFADIGGLWWSAGIGTW